MNNLFLRLKNLPFYLSLSFIFTAITLIAVNILALVNSKPVSAVYDAFYSGISALFAFCAGVMICFYVCKNTKKSVAAGYCILVFDAVLFALCRVHISFVFAIILALFFSSLFEKYSLLAAFCICFLTSLAFSLALGLGYDYLFSFLKALCLTLKGRGALFGLVNNVYSLVFSSNLETLFYHKDYSGTAFVNSNVITGVIDIFNAQKLAGINAAKYLTGKYFVNIFVSVGVFLLIYQRLESTVKSAFFLCFLLGVIFGDIRLFALFLLIYNPFMYFGYLLLTLVSYLAAYLLDIRIMLLKTGSLFELFKYMDKPIYFILTGLVITVLAYFLESLILTKFDFQSRRIVPSNIRKLVNALGGDRNIEKITGETVILRNPNLINILSLDCEIKGSEVTLLPDDISALREYY